MKGSQVYACNNILKINGWRENRISDSSEQKKQREKQNISGHFIQFLFPFISPSISANQTLAGKKI